MDNEKLRAGQLWLVDKDMLVESNREDNQIGERKVLIPRGEIVEFRYQANVNFRTDDDKWFETDEENFFNCCVLFGKIWDKIKWKNKANLNDILRLELFDMELNIEDRCHHCYIEKENDGHHYCSECL